MAFFSDTFPIELTIRIMRLLLIIDQNDPLLLFKFLEASPQYSNVVLLVIPQEPNYKLKDLGISDYIIHHTKQLKIPQRLLQRGIIDNDLTVKHDMDNTIGNLRESRAELKILLIQNFAPLSLPWSKLRFPSSTLAQVMKCCHAVVIGAYQHELCYSTFKLIKEWSRSMHIISRTCLLTDKPPDRRGKEFNIDMTSVIVNSHEVCNSECLKLNGYEDIRYLRPTCKDLKFVIPETCWPEGDRETCMPRTLLLPKYLRHWVERVYIEFHCCRIPFLYIYPRGKSFNLSSLILENAHWSPSNPFGRAPCEHDQLRGALNQADISRNTRATYTTMTTFTNITPIGIPQNILHLLSFKATKSLVWKRLESRDPPLMSMSPLVFAECFQSLTLEGTSNDAYHKKFKIWAPSMETLHIIMLSKSTRIWDLQSLLFNLWPIVPKIKLKSLHLELNRVEDDALSFGFKDIKCVSRLLETLWITGLRPVFLEDVGHHDVPVHGAVFQKLRSLRLDISYVLTNMSQSVPLNGNHYPSLEKLILEYTPATISRWNVIPLDQDLPSVQFNPIPKGLWHVCIGPGFVPLCKVVMKDQELEPERLLACKESQWASWARSPGMDDLFKFSGYHIAIVEE